MTRETRIEIVDCANRSFRDVADRVHDCGGTVYKVTTLADVARGLVGKGR